MTTTTTSNENTSNTDTNTESATTATTQVAQAAQAAPASTTTTTVRVPAYVELCRTIEAALIGVPLLPQQTVIDGVPGNKNWACFQHAESGHKVYVARRAEGEGIVHTTLKVDPETDGYIDPKGKAPGKIESFFKADAELVVANLLPLFCGTEEHLRASRSPVRKSAVTSAPEQQKA